VVCVVVVLTGDSSEWQLKNEVASSSNTPTLTVVMSVMWCVC